MKTANIHEAKAHLSELVERALKGEEVIIAKRGVPMVRLVAVTPPSSRRFLGSRKGQIRVAEDFDAPLDDFADYR
ncbi:MAG: type II toxin-antitoxin system Phd/YefM family antitoxin [Myxococcota bacterium]